MFIFKISNTITKQTTNCLFKNVYNSNNIVGLNVFNISSNSCGGIRYYSDTYKDKKERIEDDDPPPKIIVPQEKLNLQFSRSQGAGGQNVNKVNTKVLLSFDLTKSDWIPPYVKVNMRRFYKKNLNNEDEFQITSSKHRYQHLNIKDAMDKLDDILEECSIVPKERIATETPGYANEKRLKDKQIKKTIKETRRKQSTSKYFDEK